MLCPRRSQADDLLPEQEVTRGALLMPRVCTACASGNRQAIDEAIVRGESFRDIARLHGVSKDAAMRHRAHVSTALVAVQRRREAAGAETLTERVEQLYARANTILDAAEADGRPTVALGALRELRGVVELLGRLSGELDERPITNVLSVVRSEDWQRLRGGMLSALEPFPEARIAVAARLQELQA
jgi:hypothetical protein